MKTNYILHTLIMLFFVFSATAQQGINYKAIINDDNGDALANTAVAVQFTILENGTTEVYKESHSTTTDAHGIIIVNIGEGTLISGDYSTIDWGNNPHFLKTEIDIGDGLTDMGTTGFKTVPYALYSSTADSVSGPITENQNLADVIALNNSANSQIKNVTDPTEAQDAATKAYIDELIGQLYAEGALRVRDYDGNYYNTIKIGNQIWMAENLKTIHYNDGIEIPQVPIDVYQVPGYSWYENNEANKNTYGALYNFFVVETGKLCPSGWHVPSYEEWNSLVTFAGGRSVAGGKLKEAGTIHWEDPNVGATDEFNFTALPGGFRAIDRTYLNLEKSGAWWSSTAHDDNYFSSTIILRDYVENADLGKLNRNMEASVRCIKDQF